MKVARQPARRAMARSVAALAVAMPTFGVAQMPRSIAELSLEDLLKVEVTSASRKAQQVADIPSAVTVITADDIRRSGVVHVADALKLAPGVQVARIANNSWAVSIRGFNGRFANKLLVLRDGRSIYSPLFAGVFWETTDTVLEDIERIEVIRGPQAALWGANAVNGVINIITKSAANTQGTLISAAAGTSVYGDVAIRHGGKLGESAHYRVYGRGFRVGASSQVGGGVAQDDWSFGLAGFRIDGNRAGGDRYMLTGEHADTRPDYTLYTPTLVPPYFANNDIEQKRRQSSLLGRYERVRGDGNDTTFQIAYERSRTAVMPLFAETRDTFDMEAQQRLRWGAHDIVTGITYRYSRDDVETQPFISARPQSRGLSLLGAYLHDEISLVPERLKIVLGSRFETNTYTGFSMQPNARVLWKATESQTLWAAASRAVRTPTRAERDLQVFFTTIPPSLANPLPTAVYAGGSQTYGNEKVTAYEAGWRWQRGPSLSLDVTAFENRYENLRSASPGTSSLVLGPTPYVLVVGGAENRLDARTRGAEALAEWKPRRDWRLSASAAWLRTRIDAGTDFNALQIRDSNPRLQLALRSSYDFASRGTFDLWWRRVSALSAGSIPAYQTLDARIGWQLDRRTEISLVGQNLLDRRHPEFLTDFLTAPLYEIPRSAYVRLKYAL